MKKFFVICMTGLMLIAAGCSTTAPTPTAAPTDAPTTAPATTEATVAATTEAATQTPEATAEPTASPAMLEPLGRQDLMLVVEGEYFDLQSDVGDLLEPLGDSYQEKDVSGGFSGGDEKQYVYEGITITTYPAEDMFVAYSVEFTSDALDTARGVHVGSTADEVKAAFGAGFYEENGAIIYTFDNNKAGDQVSSLTFKIKDGKVAAVIIYNAGEIQ